MVRDRRQTKPAGFDGRAVASGLLC